MKLVLYGGGHSKENGDLDQALLKLVGKKSPQVTLIPSQTYDSDVEFREFILQYSKYDITKFLMLPIDYAVDKVLLSQALKSDVIHLSGGNTYYFLKYLRKSKLIPEIRKFVARGGVLTGLSAGAIIMTPVIKSAGVPSFDCDANEEKLKNLKGMNLVKFEFFPHYVNSKRYENELKAYSLKTKNPLFACPDGSGIIVEDKSMTFVGRAYCFYRGKKLHITDGLKRSA